jgi:hypothetical protein
MVDMRLGRMMVELVRVGMIEKIIVARLMVVMVMGRGVFGR